MYKVVENYVKSTMWMKWNGKVVLRLCQRDAGADNRIDRELQNFPSACGLSVTLWHTTESISDVPKRSLPVMLSGNAVVAEFTPLNSVLLTWIMSHLMKPDVVDCTCCCDTSNTSKTWWTVGEWYKEPVEFIQDLLVHEFCTALAAGSATTWCSDTTEMLGNKDIFLIL